MRVAKVQVRPHVLSAPKPSTHSLQQKTEVSARRAAALSMPRVSIWFLRKKML